jgi:glutamine---fructose-6-phosphate transaminase (isomerizing)
MKIFNKNINIFFGRALSELPENSIVFFPIMENTLCCGIAGIVAFKGKNTEKKTDIKYFEDSLKIIKKNIFSSCKEKYKIEKISKKYLGGDDSTAVFLKRAKKLNQKENFYNIYINQEIIKKFGGISSSLDNIIKSEEKALSENIKYLSKKNADSLYKTLENLKDASWSIAKELLENISKVKNFIEKKTPDINNLLIFKSINAVLNSIDRLEVRGRDSAGISLLFHFDKLEFEKFLNSLNSDAKKNLYKREQKVLKNSAIDINENSEYISVSFCYKIAAEVGRLGDNVSFLRDQIRDDSILQAISKFNYKYQTVISHTRWASVGSITEANCHPVDAKEKIKDKIKDKKGIIHVCLNGDIDNYIKLSEEFKSKIDEEITTDTKIIALNIKKYLNKDFSLKEAFRLSVNDFKGSHAIAMHTNLAPGKIFLAQQGSGQTLFIGISEDYYMPSSEVYGFIEETPYFIKIGDKDKNKGQIFILDQAEKQKADAPYYNGIEALNYDGEPIILTDADIKKTKLSSRDIDRQNYPHYFLKEISESPSSVKKTLLNRWKIVKSKDKETYTITLDEKNFPKKLQKAFLNKKIKRIFIIGQGTAGVAAKCCATILEHYINYNFIRIQSFKASELSGFMMYDSDEKDSLKDTLVIAITQSGTTTDTNKTVDMAKKRGGYTLAIVNRRDSDITFKTDGVLYTSSGRDIEMSVASTKAFYSQITAGAILGLYIAELIKTRANDFIKNEIKKLCELPSAMLKILMMKDKIKKSADKAAVAKTYWAAVGSGHNKASADEIRIKLSELCYKTVSSDYIEDKKHIDLSAEPLIIICAAGARDSVINDIIKDTAIFKAHKAYPIVIADEGEKGFAPYAEDIFYVPHLYESNKKSEHLMPVLNTLVGHIWGYYAALAINDISEYLYEFREDIKNSVESFAEKGFDMYEILIHPEFKKKIELFYIGFKKKKEGGRFPSVIGFEAASDFTLLLKYLGGKLDASGFEFDFNVKGTPLNMLNALFIRLNKIINNMARPIDAIRHQAKTVTVGTSRISEKLTGIIFDNLKKLSIKHSQITPKNIVVVRNLQEIISSINGYILYKIENLDITGKPNGLTTISIIEKGDALASIPSRVEKNNILRGTKRTIVIQGNVYIAKGRTDERNILVIPIISSSSEQPNKIEQMLLLNFSFKAEIPLSIKIKALGEKFEFIKNIVQESISEWDDSYLDFVDTQILFGRSAEKTGELIVSLSLLK